MPNHSAIAIANEFLKRRASTQWPQQMLVQKLAYIAHGWVLAITGEALIDEQPEAWDNGPVYRSIWNHVRDHGYRWANYTLTEPGTTKSIEEPLTEREQDIINAVWKKYGPMGANKLSELTHQPETPWWKAYFDRGRNWPLDNEEIRDHYTKLALAGRGESQ